MATTKDLHRVYGKHAVITRKGNFALVHLDRPSQATLRKRTREFDPADYFCEDCPLCQMLKGGGIVVFDDSLDEIEDWMP